jgi:hypothetical protein
VVEAVDTTTADITPAPLTITAIAANKVYNASTAAIVTLTDNAVPGDNLALTYASANFNNKNAGAGKPVSVTGIDVSGSDAGNYTYSSTAAGSANITPATLVVAASGSNKDYDGTTTASVTLTDNAFAGDQVTLTHGSANFVNAAVGNGKLITVGGIQIVGTAAGDYVLADATTTATGDIVLDSAYADALSMQGAWALPPALPAALPEKFSRFVDAQPPAALLDLALPPGFGGAIGGGAGPVTAALVRAETEQLPGLITVLIPASVIASGQGFSFALPPTLQDLAVANPVRVTLTNGRRAPAWLRYSPSTRGFAANGVPLGALPTTLLMRIGGQRWMVQIAAQAVLAPQ